MRRLRELEGAVSISFTSSQLCSAMKEAAVGAVLGWCGATGQTISPLNQYVTPPSGFSHSPHQRLLPALTDVHQLAAAPRWVGSGFGMFTSMLSSHVCRLATASSPRARFQVTTYRALSVKKHWLTVDMLAWPPMSHTLNDTESLCV